MTLNAGRHRRSNRFDAPSTAPVRSVRTVAIAIGRLLADTSSPVTSCMTRTVRDRRTAGMPRAVSAARRAALRGCGASGRFALLRLMRAIPSIHLLPSLARPTSWHLTSHLDHPTPPTSRPLARSTSWHLSRVGPPARSRMCSRHAFAPTSQTSVQRASFELCVAARASLGSGHAHLARENARSRALRNSGSACRMFDIKCKSGDLCSFLERPGTRSRMR